MLNSAENSLFPMFASPAEATRMTIVVSESCIARDFLPMPQVPS